jgi:ribulose bisphosphate carboxylase small subunit
MSLLPGDPSPAQISHIGQIPPSGDPRTQNNYYLRVIAQLLSDMDSGVALVSAWQEPVLSDALAAPPVGPTVGDRYIVAAAATGDWAGHSTHIAQWDGAAWIFSTPQTGWETFVVALGEYRRFLSGAWGARPSNTLTTEQVQDIVAAFLVQGTGTTLTYDDVANTFTIATATPLTQEQVEDIVGAMVEAGTNATATYDDATGKLTIDATGGDGTGLTQEQVEDIVAALLVQGTNVTLTYNDASGQLTIDAAGASSTASFNTQTGTSYTLVAGDNGKIITLSNTSPITLTVPSGLGAGFNCMLTQNSTGQVTITGSGAVVHNRQSHTKIAGQYGMVTLVAVSSNVFYLGGDTSL